MALSHFHVRPYTVKCDERLALLVCACIFVCVHTQVSASEVHSHVPVAQCCKGAYILRGMPKFLRNTEILIPRWLPNSWDAKFPGKA